jgi:predicted Zn-dependent protease with MMP-like domain
MQGDTPGNLNAGLRSSAVSSDRWLSLSKAAPASLAVMPVHVSAERFEELVDAALGEIPESMLDQIENCVVLVQDEPEPELGDLLGYYDGIPLSERTTQYAGALPDRILIFSGPLCRMVSSEEELAEEIRITVWHEVAHYFGIDDHELDDLGYA